MYKVDKFNLDNIVTRQYRLEQINDSYRNIMEGKHIRCIICYTEADR